MLLKGRTCWPLPGLAAAPTTAARVAQAFPSPRTGQELPIQHTPGKEEKPPKEHWREVGVGGWEWPQA